MTDEKRDGANPLYPEPKTPLPVAPDMKPLPLAPPAFERGPGDRETRRGARS